MESMMTACLYDTHFHFLSMKSKELQVEELLRESFSRNIRGALEAAVDEEHFSARTSLAERFPGKVFLGAGIHPLSASKENWEERFGVIRKQTESLLVIAVGETGLDYYRDSVPREVQHQAFRDHLELGVETDLPVIVHNRQAESAVISAIESTRCRKGIFHCFSANMDIAKKALDLGFFLSFAGNLTYRKNGFLRNVARWTPSDRILIETDSPYLPPQPVRGKPNHPGQISYTFEALAEVRSEAPQELAVQLQKNTRTVFPAFRS